MTERNQQALCQVSTSTYNVHVHVYHLMSNEVNVLVMLYCLNKRITEVMENRTSEPSSLHSSRCEILSYTYMTILYLCFMVCMCVCVSSTEVRVYVRTCMYMYILLAAPHFPPLPPSLSLSHTHCMCLGLPSPEDLTEVWNCAGQRESSSPPVTGENIWEAVLPSPYTFWLQVRATLENVHVHVHVVDKVSWLVKCPD